MGQADYPILVDESLASPSAGMARGVGAFPVNGHLNMRCVALPSSSSEKPRELLCNNNRNLPTIYLSRHTTERIVRFLHSLTSLLAFSPELKTSDKISGACIDSVGCPSVRGHSVTTHVSHCHSRQAKLFDTTLKASKRPVASDFLPSD